VDEVLTLIAPFSEVFTANQDLARHYAAPLVSGRHRADVFAEPAGVLRSEIAKVLTRHGISFASARCSWVRGAAPTTSAGRWRCYVLAASYAHVRARFLCSQFWVSCLGMPPLSLAAITQPNGT
jgi:hypothetical protein